MLHLKECVHQIRQLHRDKHFSDFIKEKHIKCYLGPQFNQEKHIYKTNQLLKKPVRISLTSHHI